MRTMTIYCSEMTTAGFSIFFFFLNEILSLNNQERFLNWSETKERYLHEKLETIKWQAATTAERNTKLLDSDSIIKKHISK